MNKIEMLNVIIIIVIILFKSDKYIAYRFAKCMCIGVPMRKQTWNVVSPTAPLYKECYLKTIQIFCESIF